MNELVHGAVVSTANDGAATPPNSWYDLVHRIEDLLISIPALILLSPIMLIAAIAVKLESEGPILFTQKRGGKDGKRFTIYKFRTMTAHFRNEEAAHATPKDPRKTKVGHWLRVTSIDELPQLLNVLKGDMSIIGPRPHMLDHDLYYAKTITGYANRQRVRPGLTGLAQSRGFRGMIYNQQDMQNRADSDNEYIDHWRIWLDLKILWRTVIVVFRTVNAY